MTASRIRACIPRNAAQRRNTVQAAAAVCPFPDGGCRPASANRNFSDHALRHPSNRRNVSRSACQVVAAMNPDMTADEWRVAFSDHGWHDEDHLGYVLIEDGRPVGVLGALFSRRIIGGSGKKFCDLHGWYVKPEPRAKSLLLMRPALALKDHTLTDFTASPDVIAISKRLGFATLDSHVWRFRSCRISGGVNFVTSMVRRRDCGGFDIRSGHGQARRRSSGTGLRASRLYGRQESCVVIFSRMAAAKPAHCEIHHISNPSLFRSIIGKQGPACWSKPGRVMSSWSRDSCRAARLSPSS